MPAKLKVVTEDVSACAVNLGHQIRACRKSLGVSATTAAEAAGMSRVTWFRIEKGVTSVTLGAYLGALAALGFSLQVTQAVGSHQDVSAAPERSETIPVRIKLSDYPQLQKLAWHIQGVDTVSPREALQIYERNWRHLDLSLISPQERQMVTALRQVFMEEIQDV